MRLHELCKARAVPVYDMMLEKIAEAAKKIESVHGKVLLYHGSKSGIEGVIEPKSRKQCDFWQRLLYGNGSMSGVDTDLRL